MSNTTDIQLTDSNWTQVAASPSAITIKSNSLGKWHVAIKDTVGAPAATLNGEVHPGGVSWEAGSITGTVYIRGAAGDRFAITV